MTSHNNMQYIIVLQSSASLLMKYVQERINNGWTPIGGVTLSMNHNEVGFAQAMIKSPDSKE